MINICEVGLRDGLQNEKKLISTAEKVKIVEKLIKSGIKKFELTSFVNPKIVPQMSDAEELIKSIPKRNDLTFAALVLSQSGLERALKTDINKLHIVMAVSNEFNLKNARRTAKESVVELTKVTKEALNTNLNINVTLGTAFGCPFQGDIDPNEVLDIAETFVSNGVNEITLADTTGLANPNQVKSIIKEFRNRFSENEVTLGLHFHNTRGLGLANVLMGYLNGVRNFDASIGGLGGCPFAPKAVGNVCTEDMANMFEEMGIATHTNLNGLIDTSKWIEGIIGRKLDGMMMKI